MSTDTTPTPAAKPTTPAAPSEEDIAKQKAAAQLGWTVLKDLLQPIKGNLTLISTLASLGGAVEILMYLCLVQAATEVIHHPHLNTISHPIFWGWLAGAVAALLLRAALIQGATGYAHVVEARYRASLRQRILKHLSVIPLGWFNDRSSGIIRSSLNEDVKAIHTIIAHASADAPAAISAFLIGFLYLFIVDWRLALILLSFFIVFFLIFSIMMATTNANIYEEYIAAQKGLSASAVEISDGIAEVKNFGLTGKAYERYRKAAQRYQDTLSRYMDKMGKPQGALAGLMFPTAVAIPIVIVGVLLARADIITVAAFLPFLLIGVGLPESFMRLMMLINYISRGREAAANIHRILHVDPLPEPDNPKPITGHDLRVENVSFRYGDDDVLHNISLNFQPGTVTALVGPSGGGKTTITRLLARFWDVTEGRILLGGTDLRDINSHDIVGEMAIVFQDITLLSDTVTNNIRLARPDATQAEVEAAAQAARIHDRILELPKGYDTILGSDDAHLSGGEQQRITIARAFLQDAPILLLDEATAYADPRSERAIQEALAELGRGRTVVVIAHRLQTIVDADQIVVVRDGGIEATGTHPELLKTSPTYAAMWHAQQGA